jgi:flagellar protein FlaJ
MPSLKGLATILFGGIVDKYPDLFSFVKDNLPKADIKIPFRTYVSMAFFISSIVFLACLVSLFLALQMVEVTLVQRIIYSIFVPITVAIVCFVIFTFYPLHKASSRRKNIESNLPFVLTHMAAITEAGLPPQIVFKLVSEFKEYGEISKEIQKIASNVETYGVDFLTAIKQVANRTPSEEFRQVLLGFVTTTESGGNIKTYLKNAGQEALFEWRMRREKFIHQLSTFAEFYTGLLIAAPLFIIALFSVMGMIQPTIAGFDILTLTKLSIYLIVPIMNLGFLAFLRGIEVEM